MDIYAWILQSGIHCSRINTFFIIDQWGCFKPYSTDSARSKTCHHTVEFEMTCYHSCDKPKWPEWMPRTGLLMGTHDHLQIFWTTLVIH